VGLLEFLDFLVLERLLVHFVDLLDHGHQFLLGQEGLAVDPLEDLLVHLEVEFAALLLVQDLFEALDLLVDAVHVHLLEFLDLPVEVLVVEAEAGGADLD